MASVSIQTSSSNIPSSSYRWKYDVFLSFRGEDTRKSFIDHLYSALKYKGINVFKDDKELEKGKSISPELSKAIEESRISIIVFSRNYASSTWCLDELVKIIQCMQTKKQIVIPIFYDVDPSVVRKQIGNFHEAFTKHEEAFRDDIGKVQIWRSTLTNIASLSGWDLKHRHESGFIQDIVKEISTKLSPTTFWTLEDLVGVHSRLEKVKFLINTEFNDVRKIGIYGMGGIGKTTIARVVYDSISCEFEGSSFLANVREISRKNGLVSLQKQLLSQIFKEMDINIWDVYEGIAMIRNRLRHKKVLIIVDDVDEEKQIDWLIGKQDWFGLGSRIIITTRDKHLLMTHGVNMVYKVEELDDNEALHLFRLKAFKNCQPSAEHMELSKHIVNYARGIPLAIQVLGSFLFGRTVVEWESALERLSKDSERGILDSLQISFDGLKETEKKIFLDIACFFKGKNIDNITKVFDACGFDPEIGIKVLIEKSLLTITDENNLWMHDLLQEMGQKIVKNESPNEPGKRSRLWHEADVLHILAKNTGTEVVEGILINKKLQVSANAKVFSKMTNLRLLKIDNVQLSNGLEYLSSELRLLEWHGYGLKSLPSSLQLDNIVELKMDHSQIKQLWKEIKPLNRLRVISLSHSQNLKKTPDFTNIPNLEELILEGCIRLCHIHPSLLRHKKLTLLNLKNCTSLTTLPNEIDMESLRKLILSGCLELKRFPKIVHNMECVSEIFLDGTSIKEFPFPVEHLKGLVVLSFEDCKNLESLPSNINGLESLKTLNLSGCIKLENVPENLGQVDYLEKLDLSGTAIRQPVSSIFVMKNLKELSFHGCKATSSDSWCLRFPFSLISRIGSTPKTLKLPSLSGLCSLTNLDLSDCNLGDEAIPSEIGSLVSLESLNLRKNNFVSLPESISRLSFLSNLELDGCKRLESVPELNSTLYYLSVNNCTSLRALWSILDNCEPAQVSCLNCLKLANYDNVGFSMLQEMPDARNYETNIIVPGSEIPEWFSHQNEGSSIKIKIDLGLKLKGYVVCAAFSVHKLPPGFTQSRSFILECTSLTPFHYVGNAFELDDSGQGLPDHIWLNYCPIDPDAWLPDCYDAEFNFGSSGGLGLEVKRCAVHPIYQELDKCNNLMDQCGSSTSGNLIEFHQNFDPSKMEYLRTKRSIDVSDDDNEPQAKRHK